MIRNCLCQFHHLCADISVNGEINTENSTFLIVHGHVNSEWRVVSSAAVAEFKAPLIISLRRPLRKCEYGIFRVCFTIYIDVSTQMVKLPQTIPNHKYNRGGSELGLIPPPVPRPATTALA